MMQVGKRIAGKLSAHTRAFGIVFAVMVSALTLLWNVSSGPLGNLNDIGGWDNRLIFLCESAAAESLLLGIAAWRFRGPCARLLLRQTLLAAAFVIGLFAINQKTFAYQQQIQPIVRAMDAGGLAAVSGSGSGHSAALLTLVFALTRGPVYDMYPVKLFSVFCFEALCLLTVKEAERRGMNGARADALLLLTLILPQGFLSAACAAQTEVAAVLLLALALTTERKDWRSAACMGLACALSGVCLLLLPWALLRRERAGREPFGMNAHKKTFLYAVVALGVMLLCQLPAALAGMGLGEALKSPFTVLLGAPAYASGSPNLTALFPRSAMEEMPEFFLLRRVPQLDPETLASPFYTQEHFLLLMRGLALAGLAVYAGVSAWAKEKTDGLRLWLAVAVLALWTAPGSTMALWLSVDCLCLVAALSEPELRHPACVLLFATAAGCCYPVTEEILVRPALTSGLVLLAEMSLLGMIPAPRGERAHLPL